MRRSNCLIFALGVWFRRGGYLIVRRSRHHWVPHFMWASDLHNPPLAFVPERPIEWRRLPWILRVLPLHTIVYRGTIVEGDE